MLYVRKIEIVNDNDVVICRIQKKEALEGLSEAMAIVKNKDGGGSIVEKLKRIDQEFKDYFMLK